MNIRLVKNVDEYMSNDFVYRTYAEYELGIYWAIKANQATVRKAWVNEGANRLGIEFKLEHEEHHTLMFMNMYFKRVRELAAEFAV